MSKTNKTIHAVNNRTFLIIVLSHNKEQVLTKTLYSLSGLVYPRNLYKLVVLANNCTDDTAKIAQKFGLQVFEWNDQYKQGRNDALGWALDKIWREEKKYDAFVIIEAGSLASNNFLEVMNYYIEKGSEVIQGINLVLTGSQTWKAKLIHIALLLHNNINPIGRKTLGFNMTLSGNGMCFRSNILMKCPFDMNSAGEDWEYSLSLLLKGINMDFAPEARVWSQLSDVSLKSELHYTFRGGMRYPAIKQYATFFRTHRFTKRSLHFFETLFGFITPPMVKLFPGVLAVLVINVVLWMLGFVSVPFVWAWLILTFMAGGCFFMGVVADRVMSSYLNRDRRSPP